MLKKYVEREFKPQLQEKLVCMGIMHMEIVQSSMVKEASDVNSLHQICFVQWI